MPPKPDSTWSAILSELGIDVGALVVTIPVDTGRRSPYDAMRATVAAAMQQVDACNLMREGGKQIGLAAFFGLEDAVRRLFDLALEQPARADQCKDDLLCVHDCLAFRAAGMSGHVGILQFLWEQAGRLEDTPSCVVSRAILLQAGDWGALLGAAGAGHAETVDYLCGLIQESGVGNLAYMQEELMETYLPLAYVFAANHNHDEVMRVCWEVGARAAQTPEIEKPPAGLLWAGSTLRETGLMRNITLGLTAQEDAVICQTEQLIARALNRDVSPDRCPEAPMALEQGWAVEVAAQQQHQGALQLMAEQMETLPAGLCAQLASVHAPILEKYPAPSHRGCSPG